MTVATDELVIDPQEVEKSFLECLQPGERRPVDWSTRADGAAVLSRSGSEPGRSADAPRDVAGTPWRDALLRRPGRITNPIAQG